MTTNISDRPGVGRFLILDTESVWDRVAYRRYLATDHDPAAPRWTTKRVVSASLLDLRIENGDVSHVALKSYMGGDEEQLISQLFDELIVRPDHQLVSWGGLNQEQPVLEMAAMRQHKKLPLSLKKGERFGRYGSYRHLDLAKAMKAGSYVHLSEVAAALALPAKCAGPAANVERFANNEQWKRIAEVSEIDCATTALVLISWLGAQGQIDHSLAKQATLLTRLVQQCGPTAYRDNLLEARDLMIAEITAEAWKAAA